MVNKWLKIVQQIGVYCLRYTALPCHCLLCLRPAGRDFALCSLCEAHLPWIQQPCLCCAYPTALPESLCGVCEHQPPIYERLQALWDYSSPVDAFVHKLKFGQQLHFAKLLGNLMAQHLKPVTPIDCIIPMPLHRERQRQRGFNQTLELARIIAGKLQLPIDTKSCVRKVNTLAQSGLSAQKRAKNISDKTFSIDKCLKAKHVLVIEDVVTTGNTLQAFTMALKQAGVATVEVWACCRTSLKRDEVIFE